MNIVSRIITIIVGVGAIALDAYAECVPSMDAVVAEQAESAAGGIRFDRGGRVVAPVTVNGQGPFRFVVDTGANRSVLSENLAAQLGLTPSGEGDIHSVFGVAKAPLVDLDSISYRGLSIGGAQVPIMNGDVLSGQQGLLGVDGMRGRRLRLDFESRCVEIVPSRGARRLHGVWIAAPGELRFGHLIVVRGMISRLPVNLLIDTGADSSLVNLALHDRLAERQRSRSEERLNDAFGTQPIALDRAVFIPHMSISELEVRNITAYAGDFHVFRIWNLLDEPTLLIGMDVLSQARGIAIDYAREVVYFHIRD